MTEQRRESLPLALRLADWALASPAPPNDLAAVARRLLLDVTGLCVAARHSDYVQALLTATDTRTHSSRGATLIGHARTSDPFSAALLNGTAAHGEDYDDTFEGTPVHVGAVIVPAALAACEREPVSGADLLRAIVARWRIHVSHGAGGADRHPPRRVSPHRRASALWARRSAPAWPSSSPRPPPPRRWVWPAAWPRGSSNTWPRVPGANGCTPAGRPSRGCARRCWPGPGSTARQRCWEGRHGFFSRLYRPRCRARLRPARGAPGRALAIRPAGLQTLPLRHHDPAVYRLRAQAARARRRPRAGRVYRLRGRRRHGAPAVGTAGGETPAQFGLLGQIQRPLLYRRGPGRRLCRAGSVYRAAGSRPRRCWRWPPRSATASIRTTTTRATTAPGLRPG